MALAVVLFGVFSIPTAVAGNALVLAAIWRNPSLRTTSYILLAVLASADLLTGLLAQPLYVASNLTEMRYGKPQTFCVFGGAAGQCIASFIMMTTLVTTSLMAIERWLHMARRSLLTIRRICMIYSIILILAVSFVIIYIKNEMKCQLQEIRDVYLATAIGAVVFLIITSLAYFKVYRKILHHQHQVHANVPIQNFGQPAIDLAKYKRSVCTILYILLLFYLTYIPGIVFAIVSNFFDELTNSHFVMFKLLMALFLLSSSLNPFLYCMRMKDINRGIKQIMKKMLCGN